MIPKVFMLVVSLLGVGPETEDVSLATYIRHSIHHPENTLNTKFTSDELTESIEELRALKGVN